MLGGSSLSQEIQSVQMQSPGGVSTLSGAIDTFTPGSVHPSLHMNASV